MLLWTSPKVTRREKFFDPLLSFYLEKLLKETNTKAKLNYPVAMNFSPWILLLTLVLHGKLGQSFILLVSFKNWSLAWDAFDLSSLRYCWIFAQSGFPSIDWVRSKACNSSDFFTEFFFIYLLKSINLFLNFMYFWKILMIISRNLCSTLSWLTIHFEHVQNIPPITYVVFESFMDKIHHFSSAPDFLCHIFLTPLSI